MAKTDKRTPTQTWTSTQAYIMAVICLLLGCAVGYLLRGSAPGGTAPAAAEQTQAPAGMGGGMGMGQRAPSPEQMKAMADKQSEPLREQLRSRPNDAALLAQVGNMYYDAQVFTEAIDYYKHALAVEPKNDNVRTDMATAMFYLGHVDDALTEINRALKDAPKNSNALFNRGIFKWQGKMDAKGAIADWEQLLKENPNYEKADEVKQRIAQAKLHQNIKPGQKTNKPAM